MTALALRGATDQQGTWTKPLGHPEPANRDDLGPRSALIAEWTDFAESIGVRRRHARYLVRFYLNHITGEIDFYEWVLMHADPTGETAVRNVMKEQTR